MRESLLVIDKVPGPTSFDVVRTVKKLLGADKVGHAGSLDPFASGVLVLLIGKATKLSNALLNADKKYRAIVRLGEATDTMDLTGEVNERVAVPELTEEKVKEAFAGFEGTWEQTPPMYSAKKIHGVRLYELARQNIKVRRLPIPVQIYSMNLVAMRLPDIEFEVHVSKGTYIRSLADELARRLGTVGHLHELRRLSCGEFSLEESVPVDKLSEAVPQWMDTGYRNYVRLLRGEGLLRRQAAAGVGHPLQMQGSDGKSFVN
jgi:tRNA pseudouridine55 synthase